MDDAWDLNDLPPNWTVDDIEARAPESVRKQKQLCRLILHGLNTERVSQFFLNLNYEEKLTTKEKFAALVDAGRITAFELHVESPAKADFVDAIIDVINREHEKRTS